MSDAFGAKQRVDEALEALRVGLGPYVAEKMKERHGDEWRQFASRAGGGAGGAGGDDGGDGRNALDVYALLKTILDNYSDVFRHEKRMRKARNFVFTALEARNAASHFDGMMQEREALRYLDAVRELLDGVGAKAQVKIADGLYEKQMRENPGAAAAPAAEAEKAAEPPPPGQLRPWREVAQPHADVLSARFSEAEFAANLAYVDEGRGSEEYVDPLAFFRITYLTEGLSRVLQGAVERLSKKGGDPVIGLQTNFGGGKTHTMLALYHLAGAAEAGYKPEVLHGLKGVFEAAGVSTLPAVKRAVFVGTHKGPSEMMASADGRDIRTPWGYIAWKLGGWDAVSHIAESEANYTNPGSEKLRRILEDAAPCLILLDEVVAFAKQLKDEQNEAFHAFIQSLTEAAAVVPGAMVIGSLPESEIEVGDEGGVHALRRLEKLFGRVQSAWTPASGVETFEIVRRRLFAPLDEDGEKARDATVQAYSKLYRDNAAAFPAEVKEAGYREEMKRAYPIHPEVLKRFSEDWSTLEKFQRTRGILKIMANVIYALWRAQSDMPLINLATFHLAEDKVRTAILEPLDSSYGPILQAEVDGDISLPAKIESARKMFRDPIAVTRAARAVFLATAPHGGSSRGGMTGPALRLACAQPGDQISIFGDALRELSERSAYLYREGDRYWFSTQATLNKVADERAKGFSDEDVDAEIISILRKEQTQKGKFQRVHAAPDSLIDVDDARGVALVIIPPAHTHAIGVSGHTEAENAVTDTLQRRGSGQRKFRNALVFAAPDEGGLGTCREIARKYLAWESIVEDRELRKGLTEAQIEDANGRMKQMTEALAQRVRGAWSHVLYPAPAQDNGDGGGPAAGFEVGHASVVNRAPGKSIALVVYDKLQARSEIIDELGPDNLMAELRKVWDEGKPHIEVATLLDWFASYVYLPRLRDDVTLLTSIEKLVKEIDSLMAFAESFDADTGKYEGVAQWSDIRGRDTAAGLLVWRSALPEEPAAGGDGAPAGPGGLGGSSAPSAPGASGAPGAPNAPAMPAGQEKQSQPHRFYGSIPLDPEKAGIQVAKIAENVLYELRRGDGAKVKITLEIEASSPDGYSDDVVDVVRSNIRDLKLDGAETEFEDE